MRSLRLGWSIVWRMAAWGVALGAGLGALYGPASELVLDALVLLSRALHWSIAASSSTLSVGMLEPVVFGSCIAGAGIGALLGLTGGVGAGLVMASIFGFAGRGVPDMRHHKMLNELIASVGGLVVLAVTSSGDLAATLAPAGLLFGWIIWVLIPAFIAACAAWWASNRVIARVASSH